MMSRFLMLVILLVLLTGTCSVGWAQQLGVKVPLVVFAQLRLSKLALEAGLTGTGPAVLAAKLYLNRLKLAGLPLEPSIGAGVALVRFPGQNIAWGIFALAGLEHRISQTPLSIFAELGLAFASPMGFTEINIGGDLGARLDF